jgi:hypothetical protein
MQEPTSCCCTACAGHWHLLTSFPCCASTPRSLPELAELKQELISTGAFQAVFMTGSGSTVVGLGSDATPGLLLDDKYKVCGAGCWCCCIELLP